jgi:cytochrome c peroxidase
LRACGSVAADGHERVAPARGLTSAGRPVVMRAMSKLPAYRFIASRHSSAWLLAACSAAALVACEPSKPHVDGSKASATAALSGAPDVSAKASAAASASAAAGAKPASVLPELPFFPAMETPADNPITKEKIELGKMLFFDKRLGKDGKFSCESCHFVDKGWADAKQFSEKANGKSNGRHTPSLFNVGYLKAWYWEGRAATLEKQVIAAWKGQMGAGDDLDGRVAEIAKHDEYNKRFKAVFGKAPNPDDVVKAIATFVRSIRSGNAPFDRFEKGDKKAISESAARGWELFRNKANCATCHVPPLYTDNKYHNVGIGYDKPEPDVGRFKITKKDEDKGRFKTPSLRSVTTHAPYFHDGSAATIEAAIDYMLGGGHKNDNLDDGLKKIELTKEEREDLIAFVKALEAPAGTFEPPKLP